MKRTSGPSSSAPSSPSGHSRNFSSPPSPVSSSHRSAGLQADALRRSGSVNSPSSPLAGLGFDQSVLEGSSRDHQNMQRSRRTEQKPSRSKLQPSAVVPVPTLSQMSLRIDAVTAPLPLSRNGQPLCGAVLDDKWLLLGTSAGLDFLPLNMPTIKKPLTLIKRTRFKQIIILKERSNILLAIAGRNDHVRGSCRYI